MTEKDELWAQILIWIANIVGFIWSFYSVYFNMWGIGFSWFITLFSSVLIIYYKIEKRVIDEDKIRVEIV